MDLHVTGQWLARQCICAERHCIQRKAATAQGNDKSRYRECEESLGCRCQAGSRLRLRCYRDPQRTVSLGMTTATQNITG